MRMGDTLLLAELLIARACHDVGGLAGTLTATLELALEEGNRAGASLAAAVETATELVRRVRLLRTAWGPTEAGLDVGSLHELARGAPTAQRIRLDTTALPPDRVFSPALSRLLLNLTLLGGEFLPRGGTLALAEAGEGALVATLAGRGAAWPDGFAAALADEAVAWAGLTGPRNLAGPMLALLARRLDFRLSLLLSARSRRPRPAPLLIAPGQGGETQAGETTAP